MKPLDSSRYRFLEADEVYGGDLHGVTCYYIKIPSLYRSVEMQGRQFSLIFNALDDYWRNLNG